MKTIYKAATPIVLMGIAAVYVIFYACYLNSTIPVAFRADFLFHLSKIVHWDVTRDYGQFFPFIFEIQSGHITSFQKLYALLNYFVFEESPDYSRLVAIGIMVAYWLLPVALWARSGITFASAGAVLVFALLVFSPHHAELYDWPDSIPCHHPTAMFALWAIFAMQRYLDSSQRETKLLLFAVGLMLCTVVADGSGWAAIPIFLLMFFVDRFPQWSKSGKISLRPILIALGAMMVVIGIGFWVATHGYQGQRVEKIMDPFMILDKPWSFISVFFAMIAGPWCHFDIENSWPAGVATLILFVSLSADSLRANKKDSYVWFMLGIFGLISCVLTAATRFSRDIETGFVAYRYDIYALPIYTAMLGMWVVLAKSTQKHLFSKDAPVSFIPVAVTFIMICTLGGVFYFSSMRAQDKAVYQRKETEQNTRGTQIWHMRSLFRLASTYELPRVYLETMPVLKSAGKAKGFVDKFIPAGGKDQQVDKALDLFRAKNFSDASKAFGCSKDIPEGRVYNLGWDNQFEPRARLFGAGFIRAVGYVRDYKNCDAPMDYIIMLDKNDNPLCVSSSERNISWDVPEQTRKNDIMRSSYIFDFSCPVLNEKDGVFPVKILGYSSVSQSLALVGEVPSDTALPLPAK